MIRKSADSQPKDVRPFVDNIESVNRLRNEPTILLADDDAIYVLPIDESEETEADQSLSPVATNA